MKGRKRKIYAVGITMLMLMLILMIGPLDLFAHGFYCDDIPYNDIRAEDFVEYIDLGQQDFEVQFMPVKKHFAGFDINLINQEEGNTGWLLFEVRDENGHKIDEMKVDVSRITAGEWYKVYSNASLKKKRLYTLKISAEDCRTTPYLQIVTPDYLTEENISGDLLIGYAYAESAFDFQTKVLIVLLIIAVWGFMISSLWKGKGKDTILRVTSTGLFLTVILAWNYMYSSMDTYNLSFSNFQHDSETLVSGVIEADHNGAGAGWRRFGLGTYHDTAGVYNSYDRTFLTEDGWENGFSTNAAAIRIVADFYTREAAQTGNYVRFGNGEMFRILDAEDDGVNITVTLETDTILNESKYKSLRDITFYNGNKEEKSRGILEEYVSQYGLQGKIFRWMARHMEYDEVIENLHLLCSLMTAAVFVVIAAILWKKYSLVMAGCFLAIFWLSPWIVNFARNLYWVEFTWFIPMAVGLFCAWKIDNQKCRIISYIAAFLSVLIKCLCGYEYISVIMMGLIAFLLVDLVKVFYYKDKNRQKLVFRSVFIIGMMALAGFFAAVCIHAPLRSSDGNILDGIKSIFEQDVLKRTSGADLNNFPPAWWESFNTSVWEVLCRYFKFTTEIITGVTGDCFQLLCIIPLCIFVYDYKKNQLNIETAAMYVVFFMTSVSWFILAKAHSFVHTQMNYVLWYFGYIQICFYVIVEKIRVCIQKK